MRFRGENPVFSRVDYASDSTEQATYKGVASKTVLLLLITAATAYSMAVNIGVNWGFGQLIGALIIAPIGALIFVMLAHKNAELAFVYSILYALFEGAFLGVISLIVALQVGSDAILFAMGGTFGALLVMLVLYSTRIIRVGQGVRNFLVTAMFSVFFMALISLILYLFTGPSFYFSNFYLAIVIFSTIISVLYLLYDFNRIENYVSGNAGKEYEWSMSLGLITTIVWIYIEILRLILILSRRR